MLSEGFVKSLSNPGFPIRCAFTFNVTVKKITTDRITFEQRF